MKNEEVGVGIYHVGNDESVMMKKVYRMRKKTEVFDGEMAGIEKVIKEGMYIGKKEKTEWIVTRVNHQVAMKRVKKRKKSIGEIMVERIR